MNLNIDLGDMCICCFRDTSFNAVDEDGNKLLLFVNRIPSEGDAKLRLMETDVDIQVEGFQCVECQQVECDECENLALDYEIQDGKIICSECLGKEK